MAAKLEELMELQKSGNSERCCAKRHHRQDKKDVTRSGGKHKNLTAGNTAKELFK